MIPSSPHAGQTRADEDRARSGHESPAPARRGATGPRRGTCAGGGGSGTRASPPHARQRVRLPGGVVVSWVSPQPAHVTSRRAWLTSRRGTRTSSPQRLHLVACPGAAEVVTGCRQAGHSTVPDRASEHTDWSAGPRPRKVARVRRATDVLREPS